MSFEQEPEHRYLLYHPESDELWETYNGSDAEMLISGGEVSDVTDLPQWEFRFNREQELNGKV